MFAHRHHAAVLAVLAVLVMLVMLVGACGGHARAPSPTPAASMAPDAGPAPVAAPSGDLGLNLDFESPLAESGWFGRGTSTDFAVDSDVVHGGKHSVRFTRPAADGFATVMRGMPIEAARGHSLRMSGWLRTADVAGGYAGFWCRVDGPNQATLGFDNMGARGVVGTTEWTRYEIDLQVPPEATAVMFGALLTGTGQAWMDDLNIELGPLLTPDDLARPVLVSGRVSDEQGKPRADIRVAALPAFGSTSVAEATTAADGGFSFELPPGRYGLPATSATVTAGYVEIDVVATRPLSGVAIPVGGPGFAMSGHVLDEAGKPIVGALVGAARYSQSIGDLFLVRTGADGAYRIMLPAGDYAPLAQADQYRQTQTETRVNLTADKTVDHALLSLAALQVPAPAGVLTWLKQAVVPLTTVEAGHGFADMKPLAKIIGKAKIVALGEATHGTREFFQMKHRMLEYLVAEQGFTVFAIEANWPESIAVNDYVLDGKGDPKAALAGMYFWTWNTEEVLAQIEWMRAWNADPAHKKKVKFYGFDIQFTHVAVAMLSSYLERVDADQAKVAHDLLLPLASDEQQLFATLDAKTQEGLRAYIAELVARFDTNRKAWSKQTSPREWLQARQHAVMLGQAMVLLAPAAGDNEFDARDRAMAANVQWIAEQAEPGAKIVVWAHNGHIARTGFAGLVNMGTHLAKQYKQQYLAMGFTFGEGSFQAQGQGGLNEWTIGAPPPGSLDATFASLDIPLFALDLRKPPGGAVATWLRAPHIMREIGAVFSSAAEMETIVKLPDSYDAVFFVARTTRARPVTP